MEPIWGEIEWNYAAAYTGLYTSNSTIGEEDFSDSISPFRTFSEEAMGPRNYLEMGMINGSNARSIDHLMCSFSHEGSVPKFSSSHHDHGFICLSDEANNFLGMDDNNSCIMPMHNIFVEQGHNYKSTGHNYNLMDRDHNMINDNNVITKGRENSSLKKRSRPHVDRVKRKKNGAFPKIKPSPEDEPEYSNTTSLDLIGKLKASSSLNDKSKSMNRVSATDPQSLYARKRREKINERLRILQSLVPNGTKVDISTMLDEAVQYVKFLELQIKLLSSDDLWMYAPIAYNGMEIDLDLN